LEKTDVRELDVENLKLKIEAHKEHRKTETAVTITYTTTTILFALLAYISLKMSRIFN